MLACRFMYHVHALYPRRPEESTGSPGIGVTGTCKAPSGAGTQTQIVWRVAGALKLWAISPAVFIFWFLARSAHLVSEICSLSCSVIAMWMGKTRHSSENFAQECMENQTRSAQSSELVHTGVSKGLRNVCDWSSSSEVASYRCQEVIGELEIKMSCLGK